MKRGFTLVEVIIATVILSLGLTAILANFNQCQKAMAGSKRFETAQYVLGLGEMVHPLPDPDQVSDDPLKNEHLNVNPVSGDTLAESLDMDLSPRRRNELSDYTFERHVEEIDDETLERNGHIYTIRTTVKWELRESRPREETVTTFWRKK